MTNKFMRKRDKIRAQMKSRWYYSFWGAATVAVEALINDYRSRSDKGYYMPVPKPDDYGMTIIK